MVLASPTRKEREEYASLKMPAQSFNAQCAMLLQIKCSFKSFNAQCLCTMLHSKCLRNASSCNYGLHSLHSGGAALVANEGVTQPKLNACTMLHSKCLHIASLKMPAQCFKLQGQPNAHPPRRHTQ
jgi:hypothetical protein